MLSTGDRSLSNPVARGPGALRPFLKPPVRFDILSRRVPVFLLGEEDGAAVDEIVRQLGDLNAYIGNFRAGLNLLDHADANAAFACSWAPIACRDAGMALINFRAALKGIGEALKGSRLLKGGRRSLRQVEKRFAGTFPIARARRNGVARAGSRAAASSLQRRHDAMCDAAISAHVARTGRRVTHLHQGRAIRFELSEHALWRLVAFRNEVFAVFEDAPE